MYKDKTIAVVVPAYNVEKLVSRVITTMPEFVDRIVVIDDHSKDSTASVVKSLMERHERIILLCHDRNQGVGGAIATGYKWVIDNKVDVAVVMAGDAQMDPTELPKILDPVVAGEADYVKGNRLFTGAAWRTIPHIRYLGNSVLSLLSKIASGYWHIADFQCGYTAITLNTLKMLDLDKIYKRYGMPNDFLVRLNVIDARVKDVSIRPVYHVGEKSGIVYTGVIPRILWMLCKLFFWRLKEKYIIRDFHPLVFFYLLGIVSFPIGFVFGMYLFFFRIFIGRVVATSALFAVFLFISGLQSLFFAMWFDMERNRDLKV